MFTSNSENCKILHRVHDATNAILIEKFVGVMTLPWNYAGGHGLIFPMLRTRRWTCVNRPKAENTEVDMRLIGQRLRTRRWTCVKGTVRPKKDQIIKQFFFLLLMKYQYVANVVVKFYSLVTSLNGV